MGQRIMKKVTPICCCMTLSLASSLLAAEQPRYGAAGFVPTPQEPNGFQTDTVGPRGPAGAGVFAARGLPRSFSETINVRWKTPLPRTGLGTPMVVGDTVFVACNPGWTSDAPVLLAVDRAMGAVRWQAPVDNLGAPEWSDADRAVERPRAWWNNDRLDRPLVFLETNREGRA